MRDAELAPLMLEIRYFMGVGAKLIMQDLDERLAEFCPGMSAPQYGVLRILRCRPSTIRELSDRMLLAPSTLVPIVDRLESEGLVVRGKDPGDRRRTPLVLTERAREMLAQVPAADLGEHLYQVVQSLGLKKSRQLSELLQELIEQMSPGQHFVEHILAMSAGNGERPCSAAKPGHAPRRSDQ